MSSVLDVLVDGHYYGFPSDSANEAARDALHLIETMRNEPDDWLRAKARSDLHERSAELILRILGIDHKMPEPGFFNSEA